MNVRVAEGLQGRSYCKSAVFLPPSLPPSNVPNVGNFEIYEENMPPRDKVHRLINGR